MAANPLEKDPISDVPLARRNGLDPDAVRDLIVRLTRERDEALDQGRDAYLELGRQRETIGRLQRELDVATGEIEPLRAREAAVGEALVTANDVARRVREEASREAERVVSEARREAQALLLDARVKADQTLREAAAQAAAMAEEAHARVARLRAEEGAIVRTGRDLAATLRDMAGALERAVDEVAEPEVPIVTFGEGTDTPGDVNEAVGDEVSAEVDREPVVAEGAS